MTSRHCYLSKAQPNPSKQLVEAWFDYLVERKVLRSSERDNTWMVTVGLYFLFKIYPELLFSALQLSLHFIAVSLPANKNEEFLPSAFEVDCGLPEVRREVANGSGQLFCPGKWWRHNNGEQLASARTHACALTGQWFESSVLESIPVMKHKKS